ncbi:hypothetical protein [Spirosoma rhododendri]|uniref:Outer membrane lipoprotein-sorting protein n=1 Tax=Spirosoma rhododendri TaxID=2728024 RepID=A0A7L5DUV3_9BACT|nr:hypothetical protein [Spirosoma rhododendri]QJD79340.1 outer membrane lipoprotein-sorting protein [Spirosoma rhododendri]
MPKTTPVAHSFRWPGSLLALCVALLVNQSGYGQPLTGQQILDRSIGVYRTATSYQDAGRVTTDFYEAGRSQPRFTTVRSFQTAYYRPTRQFRFHYKTEPTRLSITPDEMFVWTDGPKAFRRWTIEKWTVSESLPMLLAAATGVSGTASRKIPGLLLTEPIGAGWGVDSLTNVKLIGDAIENGHPCYRISGVYWNNKVAFLWIDKQSFLLLRIDEGYSSGKEKTTVSMTYQPVLNKPVRVVRFTPPDTRMYYPDEKTN